MPVTGFGHVNIRTADIAASARFYEDVLGLEFRQGGEVMGNRPSWLFDANGRDIIHLRLLASDTMSTGPIDHVALACEGLDKTLERLRAHGIEPRILNVMAGVTQLFLEDPHGIMLELNFPNG